MDTQEFKKLEESAQAALLLNKRELADFPKKGVTFIDFNKCFAKCTTFAIIVDCLSSVFDREYYNLVVAPEARGFILGPALALRNEGAFVPVRKAGKLPPFSSLSYVRYKTEYSTDKIEIDFDCVSRAVESKRIYKVVIYDDVLATGGTALACSNLLKDFNLDVRFVFLSEISSLRGREFLVNAGVKNEDIYSLIKI